MDWILDSNNVCAICNYVYAANFQIGENVAKRVSLYCCIGVY